MRCTSFRRLSLFALAALLPTPAAVAQGCAFFPDASATTGTPAIQPFGGTNRLDPPTANQAILFKVPRTVLPGQRTRICALGFASTDTRARAFDRITISLGQSTATALDPVFGLNRTGFTATVLDQANWRWQTPGGQWTLIGLTASFPFDPALGDLVVFITITGGESTGTGVPGVRSDATIPSVLATGWSLPPARGVVGTGAPKIRVCWDVADLQTFGGGCVGSNGRVPRVTLSGSASLGGAVTIGLQDASTSSPAALFMLDNRLRALALDLAPFGAPGCTVDTFFTLMMPLPLTNGAVSLPLQVPSVAAFVGSSLWVQWAPIDVGANALSVTTSTFGRVLIGH